MVNPLKEMEINKEDMVITGWMIGLHKDRLMMLPQFSMSGDVDKHCEMLVIQSLEDGWERERKCQT